MARPSHIAYVVSNPPEGSDAKANWSEVGAGWPHRNGKGFDLIIKDQFAISGRIVITERREPEERADRPEGRQHSAPQPGPSGRR